jgi:hypothetical protein
VQYESLSDQLEHHRINADVARDMRADAEAFKALEREHKALQAKLEAERKAWDEQHAKQHAMNTSLHERLAEAERDAARYRWLRATDCSENEMARRCHIYEGFYGDELDFQIDAEIKRGE